jgi:hypothetical protein
MSLKRRYRQNARKRFNASGKHERGETKETIVLYMNGRPS